MKVLPCILCVDDEPQILQGLTLNLRRHYRVLTAGSAAEALALLAAAAAPEVVLSDMAMPVVDGPSLLKEISERYPQVTRLLLTGETSHAAATDAVRTGQVFRFLTKPCAPDELRAAVDAAIKHHRQNYIAKAAQ
jgi:DNA-binding NtrC family response regulator